MAFYAIETKVDGSGVPKYQVVHAFETRKCRETWINAKDRIHRFATNPKFAKHTAKKSRECIVHGFIDLPKSWDEASRPWWTSSQNNGLYDPVMDGRIYRLG